MNSELRSNDKIICKKKMELAINNYYRKRTTRVFPEKENPQGRNMHPGFAVGCNPLLTSPPNVISFDGLYFIISVSFRR